MIIATLKLDEEDTLTLNDDGIWESENQPYLAKLLNLQFQTSPKKSYSKSLGGWFAYCFEVANDVAKEYDVEIELTPIPPELEDIDDGLDEDPDPILLDDDDLDDDDPRETVS